MTVIRTAVALAGKVSPGPDYKLYLSPEFVETKADFLRLKLTMARVGDVQAAKIVSPELKRFVSLAMPRQGHVTQAVRIVGNLIAKTVREWNGQISGPRPRA